ncbi:hypothetical protein HHK36_015550 [Tetracentron sinense]|uniref:RNA helicase n=1 Tax=Tetracentron sinense TaxID=13715 RepID=A0A835DGV9_TETSI|nr:hypothetical protein HHK36_015550 [Tetracentron sinense]
MRVRWTEGLNRKSGASPTAYLPLPPTPLQLHLQRQLLLDCVGIHSDMAATKSASSNGPRYAPEDPTLPKPWKGLVDGKTGYLYFWNPETSVTQYERPVASHADPASLPKPASVPISSSVQVQQSSSAQHHHNSSNEEDIQYNRGSNGGPKLAAIPGARNYQSASGTTHSHNVSNGTVSAGHEGPDMNNNGSSAQAFRSSARVHGSSGIGGGSSADSYCRQHEITVSGDDVPPPFISFESTGFPSEILREVRYLLHGGANVVRCATLYAGGLHIVGVPLYGGPNLRKAFRITQFVARAAVGDDLVCLLVRTEEGLFLLLQLASASSDRLHIGDTFLLVQNAGFSAPTPIQAQSWPIALRNRDIVAIAKTGSGKTLGYLIPSFIHLKRCRNNSQLGPTVLVLSPTRELATQIQDETVKFGRSSRISCTCLYGGAPKGPQLRELDRGADIVVATPGRLNDILEMRRISLRQVSYLVLDEADRMLDMGFEPQIRKIVKEIPARRQTLMYTATWPKVVRNIAADLLVNPVQVNIGNIDELVANKSITQYIEVVTPMEKQRRLEQILRSQEPGSKVIIFCSTKKMCDQLARNLTRQFGAAAIHGDKSQGERDYVLNQFRSGKSPILVATDVAARGLDIKDIRVVINYDFPTGIEDYVHRIGRTGRAGATGMAYTFFCDQDSKHALDLIKLLEGANQRVPSEIRDMASHGGGFGRSRRQWGSGSGGRDGGRGGMNDFSYGGRGVTPSFSGRSGRGYEGRGPGDRYNMDARGKNDWGYPANNTDQRTGDTDRGRSPSPNKGPGWGDRSRSRSRSRSLDRYGAQPVREYSPVPGKDASPSVHRSMDSVRSPSPRSPPHERSISPSDERENLRGSYDPLQQWGSSPSHGGIDGALPYQGEEEEEGMIPADEEGMIPPDEDGIIPVDDDGSRGEEPHSYNWQ